MLHFNIWYLFTVVLKSNKFHRLHLFVISSPLMLACVVALPTPSTTGVCEFDSRYWKLVGRNLIISGYVCKSTYVVIGIGNILLRGTYNCFIELRLIISKCRYTSILKFTMGFSPKGFSLRCNHYC